MTKLMHLRVVVYYGAAINNGTLAQRGLGAHNGTRHDGHTSTQLRTRRHYGLGMDDTRQRKACCLQLGKQLLSQHIVANGYHRMCSVARIIFKFGCRPQHRQIPHRFATGKRTIIGKPNQSELVRNQHGFGHRSTVPTCTHNQQAWFA